MLIKAKAAEAKTGIKKFHFLRGPHSGHEQRVLRKTCENAQTKKRHRADNRTPERQKRSRDKYSDDQLRL